MYTRKPLAYRSSTAGELGRRIIDHGGDYHDAEFPAEIVSIAGVQFSPLHLIEQPAQCAGDDGSGRGGIRPGGGDRNRIGSSAGGDERL